MKHVDTTNLISLCAGGAGLERGFSLVVENARTVCYVEREAFACNYLAEEMGRGALDAAPIWTDLRTFNGKPWRGIVDGILAGYPCQPFSLTGKRRGYRDPRHLWPHVARITGECLPAFVIFENVQGHVTMGFNQVCEDLERMGYEIAAGLFSAAEVGANHLRTRLFVVAIMGNANGEGWTGRLPTPSRRRTGFTVEPPSGGLGLFPPRPDESRWNDIDGGDFPSFPKVRIEADGLADTYKDWLRLFGNGVCPLAAANAICTLWAVVRTRKAVEI